MTNTSFRRVVTGHNSEGKAIILEDGMPPRVQRIGGEIGPLFYEIWNTRATPAPIDRASGEPAEDKIILAPPKNGTRIRVLEIPPEDNRLEALSPEQARAHFAEIDAPRPHRTPAQARATPSCTAPRPSTMESCSRVS